MNRRLIMARKTYCFLASMLSVLCALPAVSPAQEQAGASIQPRKDSIRTVQLVVDPQPEPRYALTYRLETPYMEQHAGNGALLYQTALALVPEIKSNNPNLDINTLDKWCTDPMDQVPMKEARAAVARFEEPIHCLDMAGRYEHCTWEYPIREEGLRSTKPAWGDLRVLLRMLALKARLDMADGDPQAAIETVRIGLCAARDLGNGPFVIMNLLGNGSANRMLRVLEELIQTPDAPNLYWALTALPHPLINMRRSLQMETDAAYAQVPELRRLDHEVFSNDEVIRVWNKAAAMSMGSSQGSSLDHAVAKLAITAGAMKLYPAAKQHLVNEGRTIQEVESLPNLYVVLVYQHDRCHRLADMMLKWCDVPYWQARQGLAKCEKQFNEECGRIQTDMDVIMMAFEYGMRNSLWIHFINTRMERDMAMLRCVEAIRLYAAGHEGRLPQALSDITEVPIPPDPVYGRPFSYQVTDGKAVLESAAPPDMSERDGLRYEITLRQTTK
jgi:hypothetical protein